MLNMSLAPGGCVCVCVCGGRGGGGGGGGYTPPKYSKWGAKPP